MAQLPAIRWVAVELRSPVDREQLLLACLAVRALPGVIVVRVQPETGEVAIGAVPGEPLELDVAAILAGAGLALRSISMGGDEPGETTHGGTSPWPPAMRTGHA